MFLMNSRISVLYTATDSCNKCDELIDICELTIKESALTGKRSLMFLLADFIIDILNQNVVINLIIVISPFNIWIKQCFQIILSFVVKNL